MGIECKFKKINIQFTEQLELASGYCSFVAIVWLLLTTKQITQC